MGKAQVKVYLEDVHVKLIDSLARRGPFGSHRGEVIRWIVQDFLLHNMEKYEGLAKAIERIEQEEKEEAKKT